MEKRLSGKVVIITGASSGIGAASARLLSGYGCKVVLAARQVDKMQAIASSLQGDSLVVPTDITQAEDITSLINQTIDKFGRIDVMFANAGIYIPGEFEDGDPEAFANLMNVNINGVMRCVHAALPHMKAQQSGDILVSSSISGFVDIHWEPVYSASKHAIQGFVHTLRRQVAKYGIRVGAVCPGAVANELWGIDDPVEIERLSVQERKYIQSEDVANAVAFMLSQPPHVTIRDLVMLPQKQDI
ncbi:MAG: SDR family oxidoreductase [Chloroflexi bacterium]|nr:SDR family oxidoreductase [Chloroflexota bacterium]MCC6892258.1 SDR family oxidoreductase [Anaerolineae bacterium]